MVYVTRHRLYLTTDMQHVVGEGHPEAAVLFAPVGGQLEDHQVETLGIAQLEAALDAEQAPLPSTEAAPDEDDQPEDDDDEEVEEEGEAGEAAPAEGPAGAAGALTPAGVAAQGAKQVRRDSVEDKALKAQPQRRAPPKAKPKLGRRR